MRSILTALQEGRLFELPDNNKARALEFLARILDANPDIEVGTDAIEEIQRREEECNTGMGLGVGVPHVRAKREEGELFCAIGWTPKGIDYGAADGAHVHLVFMFYIPGAQKNIYLKEISSLFKAIKKSGSIDPIAHAEDLNTVRNLLLDWVGAVLGESGPESVARMIKLEVRQAQAPAVAAASPSGPVPATGPRPLTQIAAFGVLVSPPAAPIVLSSDTAWTDLLEKQSQLAAGLASGVSFEVGGKQIVVTGVKPYPNGRVLYDCIAVTLVPTAGS
jgi:mannitol/fructose-specific phosphotransferase system IIA component (Ntr-type)